MKHVVADCSLVLNTNMGVDEGFRSDTLWWHLGGSSGAVNPVCARTELFLQSARQVLATLLNPTEALRAGTGHSP